MVNSSLRHENDFKMQGEQVGTVHAGRSPWLRLKDSIFVIKFFVGIGKVKISKAVNDISCGADYKIRARIIFR